MTAVRARRGQLEVPRRETAYAEAHLPAPEPTKKACISLKPMLLVVELTEVTLKTSVSPVGALGKATMSPDPSLVRLGTVVVSPPKVMVAPSTRSFRFGRSKSTTCFKVTAEDHLRVRVAPTPSPAEAHCSTGGEEVTRSSGENAKTRDLTS